ncbi:MAG: shikimate kinase, partial [Clostridia bacterium]|nr:shikimate kinase [Clostridia bacterium]
MDEKIFGLIGRKLGHSDSAIIHDKFGLKNYRLFEIEPDEIERFLNTPGLKGLNVTIPYKRDVMPFMDELSDEARAVG